MTPEERPLQSYLQERAELIEDALDRLLPPVGQRPEILHQAMRYSALAGGKRLRPILLLAACEAIGGELARALPAACAVEMVHCYSLIHDDLPAMDDDDYRRGRATNHKVYGEAVAILAGDGLLTQAFVLLSDPLINDSLTDACIREIIQLLSQSAGTAGMVAGQVVDMQSETQAAELATLEFIHRHKTGALIRAAVEMGAVLGGATPTQRQSLQRYAEAAGLAFQIADDILDIVADQSELGKDVGSDQQRGKVTYPGLLGLEAARQRATQLQELALQEIADLGPEAWPLREIASYITARSK